jgi:hypothetical protein
MPTTAELGFELDLGSLIFLVFSFSEILDAIFCAGSLVSSRVGGCPLLIPLLHILKTKYVLFKPFLTGFRSA